MIKRKLREICSIIYRNICYPYVRIVLELKTHSIMEQGSYLNKGTILEGRNYIGKKTCLSNVSVGYGTVVNRECDLSNTVIGKYTSLGSRITTELGSHPLDGKHAALHTAFYSTARIHGYTYTTKNTYKDEKRIGESNSIQAVIGNDVWIGNNVSIVEGVTIGDGAAVASGAVVTKDIEPYAIYAGVPARKMRDRFDRDRIDALLDIRWWEMDEKKIIKLVRDGAFDDVDKLIEKCLAGRSKES